MAVVNDQCVVEEALIGIHPDTYRSPLGPPPLPLVPTQPSRSVRNLVSWAFSGTYDENKPTLTDAEQPSRYLTKFKAIDLMAGLAGSFEPRRTVCVHSPNDVLYPVLVLAILAPACTWTGTNAASTSVELQHHFTSSKATCVITHLEHLQTVQTAIDACVGNIEIVIWTDILSEDTSGTKLASGHRTLHDLLQRPRTRTLESRLEGIPNNFPATIFSTSGTTGLPKMIQRTHRELILESKATEDVPKPYPVRRLYCTPMFHAYSFIDMTINSFRLGLPSFYMRRYDESFAQKVHQFSATETLVAPPVLMRLSNQAKEDPEARQNIQSLQTVICAGAPLSAPLRLTFVQLFEPPVRLIQGWSMSEGGWFTTFPYPESASILSLLVDGRQLASELLVRAPQMPRSYLDNPSATAEAFTVDGWLRTGDIGYSSDGKIYLVDRVKDMIKVNGWSVAPAELEAALYKNPRVLDADVVGHGSGVGEHPVIFVVAKGGEVSCADITDNLLLFVARFKVAKCEVRFVNSIPRNPSGKILRKGLRELL
ncbi:AMP-dependent synthetase and ligase [Rhexocercosporidium sp. MPI-PUGE-AT-0058]|nr:AMP-dependent synthetase and ligase [Rhexocercosporidium sp. MPI-PUGE-AT-0058]